jgi:hypothetical protein
MNYIFITLIIVLVVIFCYNNKNNKENYYNTYGNYIDGPFLEKDDRECRQVCMRMSDCAGYNYDPTTGSCYLHNGRNEYIYPYTNHFLYPYYDDYLYKYAWWLYGKYDSPKLPDLVLSEENLKNKSLLPENNNPKTLEILMKSRPILNNKSRWTNKDYFNKGYRNNMGGNLYYGQKVRQNRNKPIGLVNGGERSMIGNYHEGRLGSGTIGGLLGGGHGGRVRGNLAGTNEIEYVF